MLGNPRGMSTGVKVRVSRIKKVATDDEEDADVDGEVGEKDLEADELEELKMDRRIKQATKKMEEMVKQQLRDSGVVPSGSFIFCNPLPSTPPMLTRMVELAFNEAPMQIGREARGNEHCTADGEENEKTMN